jgi:hypothetical protein
MPTATLTRGTPFSGFLVAVLKSVLTCTIAQIDTEFFLETIQQTRTFFVELGMQHTADGARYFG